MKDINEQRIKIALIDRLLSESSHDSIIAAEVPYLSGKRWADLLLIENNLVHAFEIKSASDSLDKLENQTNDYINTFDYTTVVLSTEHLYLARRKLHSSVGIITIDGSGVIKNIRKAKLRKKLNKDNLLYFLWRSDLLKALKGLNEIKNQQEESFILREKVSQFYEFSEIKKLAIESLKRRYSTKYNNFLEDRGNKTTLHDLLLLTIKPETLSVGIAV